MCVRGYFAVTASFEAALAGSDTNALSANVKHRRSRGPNMNSINHLF